MSTIVPRNRADPTGTKTVRERYAQKLRGAFGDLNTAIREGIIDDDVLGLTIDTLSDPPNKDFRFLSDSRKQDRFNEWLEGAIASDVLTTIDRDGNTYIRSAYARGVKDADTALRAQGVNVPNEELNDIFNMGVHRNALQDLYTRNFEALENITADMSDEIGEELAKGFAQGQNPKVIARNLTDRVNKIGKTRATQLARTEIIHAHNTANLNRLERMGVGTVEIRAEFLSAGDDRVCPLCASLEGRQETYTIDQARNGTWQPSEDEIKQYAPPDINPTNFLGEFSLSPPIHVNCRCRWLPSIS